MNEHPLWARVDAASARFKVLADNVWAVPETCYRETASAALHAEELAHHGFRVTQNVADIPTAARTSRDQRGAAALIPSFTADEFGLDRAMREPRWCIEHAVPTLW